MKNTPLKYRLNVIGGALIIFVCIRTYIPLFAANMGFRENFDIWLLIYMLTLALACIWPVAFIEKMCDFHPAVFKKYKPTFNDGAIISSGMFIFILLAMVNSVFVSLLSKVGINFPPQQLEPINSPLTLVLYFAFSTIVPAVCEELFIRGTVMNLLLPNGKRFAVLASAFIFTMMHTQVQSFIPVFGAGVVLACVYLYTGSIYASMALHFINNAYSFLMLYMQQRVNAISAIGFASFVMAVILGGGACSSIWLKQHNINIFVNLKKDSKDAKLARLFGCPVLVLGLICCGMAIFSQLYTDLLL